MALLDLAEGGFLEGGRDSPQEWAAAASAPCGSQTSDGARLGSLGLGGSGACGACSRQGLPPSVPVQTWKVSLRPLMLLCPLCLGQSPPSCYPTPTPVAAGAPAALGARSFSSELTQGVGFQIPSNHPGSPISYPFSDPSVGTRLARRQVPPPAGFVRG